MELICVLEPDFFFPDDRGTLTQITRGGYTQINAVYTKKGAVRGNRHYHRSTKEAFYIIRGRVRVTARRGDEIQQAEFSDGDYFRIDEYTEHTFEYLDDTYLVVLYTSPVEKEDGTKDIVDYVPGEDAK
ncbi:MAG: cupin domain-containing protein [Clostridia bacterium]|nr:cupin domain-containing protein [Clostridia bacterium]MBR5426855.1 cupin domain-containing protein [Clostridia bacterium]